MKPCSSLPGKNPSRACILVAEDELLLRMMISDELRDAGYDVIEAFSADEAAAILRSGAQVDLVLSDVRMPGSLDGLGLLTIVKGMSPDLPVIIMSAHLQPSLAASDGAAQFLAKPFTMSRVVEAVGTELSKIS
ncbi:MAG: response regulator [Sphingomicrobium sp.]